MNKELNSPNDVVARSDGAVYFTDPTYGRMPVFGLERKQELEIPGNLNRAVLPATSSTAPIRRRSTEYG